MPKNPSKAQEEGALNVVVIHVPTSVREDIIGDAGAEGEGRQTRQQSLIAAFRKWRSLPRSKKRWKLSPWEVVCPTAPRTAELGSIEERSYSSATAARDPATPRGSVQHQFAAENVPSLATEECTGRASYTPTVQEISWRQMEDALDLSKRNDQLRELKWIGF